MAAETAGALALAVAAALLLRSRRCRWWISSARPTTTRVRCADRSRSPSASPYDLGGSASIYLGPRVSRGINYVPVAPRTVTAEQCPQQCTVSFEVDPTTWDSPLPSGCAGLAVDWYSAEGRSGSAYRGISYMAPVGIVWISASERDDTVMVRGYQSAVMDTGGWLVVSGSGERIPGEVLEARVYRVRRTSLYLRRG
jgi:hypothetical protein